MEGTYECPKCGRFFCVEMICSYCLDVICRDVKSTSVIKRQEERIKELEKIADLALDLHTKDPLNIKKKWGVSGVQAEKLLCEMIEAQKGV